MSERKEVTVDDLIKGVEELVSKAKSKIEEVIAEADEPKTVEDLDKQTDFVEPQPKPFSTPKWKAIDLNVKDVILNTLGQKEPITVDQSIVLKNLVDMRNSLLSRMV